MLNRARQGLGDERSRQPEEMLRVISEVAQRYPSIPVLAYLENVASMPAEVRKYYDELVGGPPVMIDSGIFGWVRRRRLYWGVAINFNIASLDIKTPPRTTMVKEEGGIK